jgi:hypothetical protein
MAAWRSWGFELLKIRYSDLQFTAPSCKYGCRHSINICLVGAALPLTLDVDLVLILYWFPTPIDQKMSVYTQPSLLVTA